MPQPQLEHVEHQIAEALAIKESLAHLAARLRRIEDNLERAFPGRAQVEHMSTACGTVHRIVEEDVYLDPRRAPEVMAHLGSQFQEHFQASFAWRPTPALLAKVADAGSFLGAWVREYLVVERRRHFDFSPGKVVIDIPAEGRA